MRRTYLLSLLALSLIAGCGDPNAGRLFADLQYATRCEETLGCPRPVEHDICGYNLSDPCEGFTDQVQASCNVNESESSRTLGFSATQGSGFSIRVQSAIVPSAGGAASGTACRVTVVEGANTYEGLCGPSLPSEAQPCQITEVMFYDDMGNPTVEGRIWCQHLPNRSNPTLLAEVTALGDSPEDRNTPGRFRFANCDGLELGD